MTTLPEGFDARRFKALERSGFNRIATRYADGAPLRASLQAALLDAAALQAGEHVLDLAAGPGLLARDALRQVQPGGRVVASDIAEGMLAEGCQRASAEGLPALLAAACDAEHLAFADRSFDTVLVGLGLFIFPEPARALAELRRVIRPGGRIALSVWGHRESVPLISRAQDCIARLLPAPRVARPSVFRLGEPAVLEALLRDAGFGSIRIEAHTLRCRFANADAYWQAFLDLAGGAAEALARLPDATQALLRSEVAAELAPHRVVDGSGDGMACEVEGEVLIATAWR
ncbi:class I SAM-dependent methyltransferase [Zoogloea dura]|jgi:ubiquinone/menaquinone biosynthesis C-methylase UbiE|uniref:Class I SAM-dependent methyltransferase n=1 Tax=Zoogloea dura TaxID=2728840 RepID=A0A848G2S0_9RHOO|nr:class I SAM-dependent methyltransferase [Zoogloea dura]NML25584.1 class I SAM-dependent methyltransferase [Zoogloea dura]